jgi:V/A-type H+-transporting ATPase subunit C
VPSATANIRQLVQSYRYAYPTARVKALKSFLLTEKKLEDIIEAKDLGDAATVMRDTVYARVLEGKNGILDIEKALRKHLTETFLRISDFLPGNAKTVLREYLGRFEAGNIKFILVGIYAKLPAKKILHGIVPLQINLPEGIYEKLASSKSVGEAVSGLDGTVYYLPLNQAYKEYKKSRLLLPLETALDFLVYERTFKTLPRVGGSDIESLERMIGIEVDLKNIKTVLRLRHEHVKPEDITKYLIPHGYRLSVETLEEISEAVDIEEIITSLERSYYHDPLFQAHMTFEKTRKDKRLNMLERALDDFQTSVGRSFEREYPLGIGPILGYMIAKTHEVGRLIAILKLKDEGFTESEIKEITGA